MNMYTYIRRGLLALCYTAASATTTFAADGFGRATTGGSGGAHVAANTVATLKQYAESTSPYNILVSGTIDLGVSGRINVKSNKTIKGANSSATIKGTLNLNGVKNVFIQNLNISANTGAPGVNDGITINNSSNVFVTKCSIYNCTDGNLDIAKGSDLITVSWCKFYYTRNNGHNFSNLIGSSDTDVGSGDGRSNYRITWHHNWWSTGCKQRMPADRFGQVHVYNNYYDCAGNDYCTTSRNIAQMLNQNNYYQGVKNPLGKEGASKLKTSGNIYNSCTGNMSTSNDSVFTPPYGYALDATANVPARVKAGAGNR